jgi:hypothetical protein
MCTSSPSHPGGRDLRSLLHAAVAQDRVRTAELLACIAEVDARQLWLKAGHPSMEAFYVYEFGFDEDEAIERVRAARAARRFPAIFEAVAEGRLDLGGVVRLAPYLTPENAHELLTATAYRGETEIAQILAERFPPAVPTARIEATSPPPSPAPPGEPHAPTDD